MVVHFVDKPVKAALVLLFLLLVDQILVSFPFFVAHLCSLSVALLEHGAPMAPDVLRALSGTSHFKTRADCRGSLMFSDKFVDVFSFNC